MKLSKGKGLLLLGFLLVVVDQVMKILVKTNMSLGEHFPVIGNWFQILFIENEGMAFGMKFGGTVGKAVLSIFRIALFAFLCWWITRLVRKKDSDQKVPCGVLVGLTLIAAGALGNIIDSLFYGLIFSESAPGVVATFGGSYAPFLFGKVVDMLYFPIIDTTWPNWVPFVGGDRFLFFAPVFNFADSCVTVGALYLILFQFKFFTREEKKKV
ncbi:MAG: lipoprotein signal peptidase [Bacteroidales bacterium]|nr:lipoprotein signal peptidase [Bacteroidota bacterium]NLN99675.1 lipoprotein signal peptidase [Bacteroidales bacterium]